MKKTLRAVGLAAGTMLCASGLASAAGVSDATVKVPFAFIVGNIELPAGDYVVKEPQNSAEAVELKSADGRTYATTLTIPREADEQATHPEVVFEKFDDHYFLADVMVPDGSAREVVLTPAIMQRAISESAAHAN